MTEQTWTIKKLEWRYAGGECIRAITIFGVYEISKDQTKWRLEYYAHSPGDIVSYDHYDSEQAATTQAQAHYEQQMAQGLTPVKEAE